MAPMHTCNCVHTCSCCRLADALDARACAALLCLGLDGCVPSQGPLGSLCLEPTMLSIPALDFVTPNLLSDLHSILQTASEHSNSAFNFPVTLFKGL